METMTQPKVTGYRQLSEKEGVLMNKVKALAGPIEALRDELAAHIAEQRSAAAAAGDADEIVRIEKANPEFWLRRGIDGMQSNLMFLTRAVAQPTTF